MRKWAKTLSKVLPRKLALLDIGARGGPQSPWDDYVSLIYFLLVEPEPVESIRLLNKYHLTQAAVLPYALWKERSELHLNITKSRGNTSIYIPNRDFLKDFPDPERFCVEKTLKIESVSIDDLSNQNKIPNFDFAKIDVQGAELAILEGGAKRLAVDLVGLEVEVEFAQMYVGQPLFGDVEAFVRESLGLDLWDLRKTYWKYSSGKTYGASKGRLIFGDALFFRRLDQLDNWYELLGSSFVVDKINMLVFSALVYGYGDYAWEILRKSGTRAQLSASNLATLELAVQTLGKGVYPFSSGSGRIYAILDAVAKIFKPNHGGWATIGQTLGNKRRGPFWT